jgi:hypothetical protein
MTGPDASRRLPSKKANTGVTSSEERGSELYPTPRELTHALAIVEKLPKVIWEPAAGKGDMSDALSGLGHRVIAEDLIDYNLNGRVLGGIDFLQTKMKPDGCDCIVTNPPFSVADDFVRHGLKLCRQVFVLNRLAFLEGTRRGDIIDKKLARVWVFKERPPMMHRWMRGIYKHDANDKPVLVKDDGIWREWSGKKADSAMPVAWFCFESDHNGAKHGFTTRRVSWRAPRAVPNA